MCSLSNPLHQGNICIYFESTNCKAYMIWDLLLYGELGEADYFALVRRNVITWRKLILVGGFVGVV